MNSFLKVPVYPGGLVDYQGLLDITLAAIAIISHGISDLKASWIEYSLT